MPELDPVYYEAIDTVLDRRAERADWDKEEMRDALLGVAKGSSQSAEAEEREFSQAAISRAWSDVEEEKDKLLSGSDDESSLWRDPTEEAVSRFRDFFERMNEKYDMGIRDTAVQMMVDEIRDTEQLPSPMYLERFLKGAKSGIKGADVDYVKRRYEWWLENEKPNFDNRGPPQGAMGRVGGQQVSGQQQQQSQPSRGVPIAGGGGQQPEMPPTWGGGHQGAQDPGVAQLREEIRELKSQMGAGSNGDGGDAMIQIERDDGSVVTLPASHPAATHMLDSGGSENEMLKTLKQAKELGLIPDPNERGGSESQGEKLAKEIGRAIESLGERQAEAQQQMGQSFQQALARMEEMVVNDDDDDLTIDDVRAVINEEMKEDELTRLERQMEEMQSQFASELRDAKKSNSSVMDDPDMFKADREMELRQQQLQALNENVKEMPSRVAAVIQKGVLPMMDKMGEQGGGSPLWSPPEHGRGQGSTPDQRQQPDPQPQPQGQPQHQDRQPEPREPRARDPARGSPSADEGSASQSESDQSAGESQPQSEETAKRAQDVYGKLGIGEAGDATEDDQ